MLIVCPPAWGFKVGDRVDANVGQFKPGTIVTLWPSECTPYAIELDEGGTVTAPMDIDEVVRAWRWRCGVGARMNGSSAEARLLFDAR